MEISRVPLGPLVGPAFLTSEAVTDWIRNHHAPEISSTVANLVAVVMYGLAIEHRAAILLLVQVGARSSAMALARSVFEACIRGLWAAHVAEEELSQFIGDRGPKLETMVQKLSKVPEFADGVFAKIKDSHWETLCDYAHGGARQYSRWLSDDGIGPVHADKDIVELLTFIDLYGLLATIGANEIAGNDTEVLLPEVMKMLHRA